MALISRIAYRCWCGRIDYSYEDRREHQERQHNSPVPWFCAHCKASCSSGKEYFHHILVHDREQALEATITKPSIVDDIMEFIHLTGTQEPTSAEISNDEGQVSSTQTASFTGLSTSDQVASTETTEEVTTIILKESAHVSPNVIISDFPFDELSIAETVVDGSECPSSEVCNGFEVDSSEVTENQSDCLNEEHVIKETLKDQMNPVVLLNRLAVDQLFQHEEINNNSDLNKEPSVQSVCKSPEKTTLPDNASEALELAGSANLEQAPQVRVLGIRTLHHAMFKEKAATCFDSIFKRDSVLFRTSTKEVLVERPRTRVKRRCLLFPQRIPPPEEKYIESTCIQKSSNPTLALLTEDEGEKCFSDVCKESLKEERRNKELEPPQVDHLNQEPLTEAGYPPQACLLKQTSSSPKDEFSDGSGSNIVKPCATCSSRAYVPSSPFYPRVCLVRLENFYDLCSQRGACIAVDTVSPHSKAALIACSARSKKQRKSRANCSQKEIALDVKEKLPTEAVVSSYCVGSIWVPENSQCNARRQRKASLPRKRDPSAPQNEGSQLAALNSWVQEAKKKRKSASILSETKFKRRKRERVYNLRTNEQTNEAVKIDSLPNTNNCVQSPYESPPHTSVLSFPSLHSKTSFGGHTSEHYSNGIPLDLQFSCTLCSKSFRRKDHLNRHSVTHSNS